MKILIVAATSRIVRELKEYLVFDSKVDEYLETYHHLNLSIDFLITGIGSVFTTYHVTRLLEKEEYDLAINIGIAGSFDHFLEQGFVVNVIQDQFSDLGFEDKNTFYTLYEKELMDPDEYPFVDGLLHSLGNLEIEEVEALIPVKAVTVNTLLGTQDSIDRVIRKYNPEIETTEGAAFMYSCMKQKVPFLQIRSISYFVEIRRVESWNIPVAINTLSETIISIFEELKI